MNILNYCYDLLTKLKNGEISFSHVINKKVDVLEVDTNSIDPIKDALKAIVNRYYFLAWEIKHYLKGIVIKENELDYLIISLAFLRYSRNGDTLKIESQLIESLNSIESKLDQNTIIKMLQELKSNVTSLPEVFNENFSKKISLNYSYPEWLVTMIRKHFGTRNSFKAISSSRKSVPISICSNELLVDQIDHPSFKKSDTTPNSYFYIGKKKLFEEELFMNKKIFVLDQSEQKVLESLKIIQGEKIVTIGDFEPSFLIGLCIKIQDLGKVRAAIPSYANMMTVSKIVSKYKFRCFEAFESPINLVCTHCDNSNDRVIVMPKNSEFGLIRKKPEILLSFNRDQFDVLIQEQYEALKEASNFVKNDGELDYIVPTLNKKESFAVVRRFLEEHQKFGLISEQLIFPFEYGGEGIYFARIRKLGN